MSIGKNTTVNTTKKQTTLTSFIKHIQSPQPTHNLKQAISNLSPPKVEQTLNKANMEPEKKCKDITSLHSNQCTGITKANNTSNQMHAELSQIAPVGTCTGITPLLTSNSYRHNYSDYL